MTATEAQKPIPPGSFGWPVLGETLVFLKDMFGFIAARTAEHGPVFRTKILGTPTAIISGTDACELWLDTNLVQREGSFPNNLQELFGGRSLPLLDGEEHSTRKRLVLEGFTREALAQYLPVLQSTTERYLARWTASNSEIAWLDEFKQLAIEGICATVFGMQPGAEMDALLAEYRILTRGFTGLPINLPGTLYNAGLHAKDRILTMLEARIREREQSPGTDGLSRMLAARAPDGTKLTVDQLKLELHHVMIAGLIIFAEFGETVVALKKNPEVLAKLEVELREHAPTGPLTPKQLREMPYLLHVVMETKRTCPNVPMSFGKAKATFEFNGYSIPQGWLVFMAVGANNMHKGSFVDPERFDPDRFGPGRAEHEKHPHAYVPQGAGPDTGHKCAGLDLSTLFMQVFTGLLVRGYTWELPEQDTSLRWDIIPPEPKDGLRAKVHAR